MTALPEKVPPKGGIFLQHFPFSNRLYSKGGERLRTEDELTQSYLAHCKTVWNICYPYFLSQPDTEDAVQDEE